MPLSDTAMGATSHGSGHRTEDFHRGFGGPRVPRLPKGLRATVEVEEVERYLAGDAGAGDS